MTTHPSAHWSGSRGRPQLADEVADHLRARIMSGDLPAGRFVRLEEVAKELDVSVTPVREALVALRGEDMVELVPRRGYVVNPLSEKDVRDVFWLQAELAAELAARAAAVATEEDLARLRALADEQAAAVEAEAVDKVERLEYEFHRTVNLLADSRKLSWFLNNAMRYTPVSVYLPDPAWHRRTLADHEAILTALAERDVPALRAAMAAHFADGADRLVAHLG